MSVHWTSWDQNNYFIDTNENVFSDLDNVCDNFRHGATLFLQNFSAFFFLGWNGDDGTFIFFFYLALSGVDRVILDNSVDLTLLIRNISTLPLHYSLLLCQIGYIRHIDTLKRNRKLIKILLEVYHDSELYLLFLSGNTLILHLGDNLIFTLIVGDILTLRLSDQSTLLFSYIIANLFTDGIISRRKRN